MLKKGKTLGLRGTPVTLCFVPRPLKPRRCWGFPPHGTFVPVGVPPGRLQAVFLQLDELEALRLCDLLNMDQEEAGRQMGVSRATVQRLLASARAKVAEALVYGKALIIVHGPHVQFEPGSHCRGGPPWAAQ